MTRWIHWSILWLDIRDHHRPRDGVLRHYSNNLVFLTGS